LLNTEGSLWPAALPRLSVVLCTQTSVCQYDQLGSRGCRKCRKCGPRDQCPMQGWLLTESPHRCQLCCEFAGQGDGVHVTLGVQSSSTITAEWDSCSFAGNFVIRRACGAVTWLSDLPQARCRRLGGRRRVSRSCPRTRSLQLHAHISSWHGRLALHMAG
jgi:hypothetical protein